jgi:uncharacterized protein YdeI (YjbR/CyaY-like superfamily)
MLLSFESTDTWRQWLEQNYELQSGIWLRFYKKTSGIKTLIYDEALDVALCFGWIDGQAKKLDEISYQQKFTPRRPQSLWSKRNIGKATQLIKENKMHAAGLLAIEAAKADGRWQAAYDSPSNMTIPEDFLLVLKEDKFAYDFFESLNRTNKYAIVWRLQTAKNTVIKEKRMKTILEMLKKGEKFHN